ncbi:NAD(P)-dependent oxidoreductase [Caballeronia glebae]|uniref:NAD(P)-dependent oxidoreductase n=1 Tax=Caballeronia glebae TaxID=1777143 RepID=UPI0038BC7AD9
MANEDAQTRGPVGVIGLGNMGGGMVKALAREGYNVVAYDVSEPARKRASEGSDGVLVVDSLEEVLDRARTIVVSLPRPEHVGAVLGENGLLKTSRPATLVIDASTNSPTLTIELGKKLADKGHALVDAPVSGGARGAAEGTLSIMAGGSDDAIEKAMPVLNAMGTTVKVIGKSGTGQIAKLVNNVLTAANRVAAGEAFFVGSRAGVPVEDLVTVVNASSGGSRITEKNYPAFVLTGAFNSGMTMGLLEKDISLMLALAEQTGSSVPVLKAVVERWRTLREHHGCDADAMRSTQIADL